MARVIDLSAADSSPFPAPASPALPRRLIQLSRLVALIFSLCFAAAVLFFLAAAVVTLFFSDHIRIGSAGVYLTIGHPPPVPGTALFSSASELTRLAGIIDVALATAPLLLLFRELRRLFALYARGTVFARENAIHLQRAGTCLAAYPFAKLAANLLFRLAGGTDQSWFSMDLVYSLILGLVVLAMARVMEFGHEIEQERSEFV